MATQINHKRLAYSLRESRQLLGSITDANLKNLVRDHGIAIMRVEGKPLIPAFELDRLVTEMAREARIAAIRVSIGDD
jgi:hypothetical protein